MKRIITAIAALVGWIAPRGDTYERSTFETKLKRRETPEQEIAGLRRRVEIAENDARFYKRESKAREVAVFNAQQREEAWKLLAESAEAARQRVEALCKDSDGEWLESDFDGNTVGDIRRALDGAPL